MSELLLQKVLAKLDVLCLEYHADGYFSCVGQPPAWAVELFLCIRNRFPRILPQDISTFLDDFMVDAVEFWNAGHSTILRSGYWTESSSIFGNEGRDNNASREVNLEALVLSVDGHSLMLLEVSAVKFDETRKWLQLARGERLDALVERKANASQMTNLSLFDPLTGCSNEQALTIQLAQWLEQLRRGFISQFVLIILNVDRFRYLNFTRGLASGDQCLMQIAQRLKAYVAPQDVMARVGADEFALLVRIPSGLSQEAWTERLMSNLRSPYRLGTHQVYLTISLGLLKINHPNWDVEQCLLRASMALTQAQKSGRGQSAEFHESNFTQTFAHLNQEQQLLGAIANQELQAAFRPLFSAQSRRVVGCEPILNWTLNPADAHSSSRIDAMVERANLTLQLTAYQIQACAPVLSNRSLDRPLSCFIRGPLQSVFDPQVQQAVQSLTRLFQPGDQLILKVTDLAVMDAAMFADAWKYSQTMNLKLCLYPDQIPALEQMRQLAQAVQFVSIAFSSSSPPLSIGKEISALDTLKQRQQVSILGEQIDESVAYQRAIAMGDVEIYAGDHFSEPLPLNVFAQLLQS